MTLRQAQRKADKAWAAWIANPTPQTKAASRAAFATLVQVQHATPSWSDWTGSPDTQPLKVKP